MSNSFKRGAGGTPGGLGAFVMGLVLTLIGGYWLLNQIQVSSNFWSYRYYAFNTVSVSPFGVTLIMFLLGVVIIFFNVSAKSGWFLAAGSFFLMIIGVLSNLEIYFARTSLFVTLAMLGVLAGGIGLMLRAVLTQKES